MCFCDPCDRTRFCLVFRLKQPSAIEIDHLNYATTRIPTHRRLDFVWSSYAQFPLPCFGSSVETKPGLSIRRVRAMLLRGRSKLRGETLPCIKSYLPSYLPSPVGYNHAPKIIPPAANLGPPRFFRVIVESLGPHESSALSSPATSKWCLFTLLSGPAHDARSPSIRPGTNGDPTPTTTSNPNTCSARLSFSCQELGIETPQLVLGSDVAIL